MMSSRGRCSWDRGGSLQCVYTLLVKF